MLRVVTAFGFGVVALLCAATAIDFWLNPPPFPGWFTGIFPLGLLGVVALSGFYVAQIVRGRSEREGNGVWIFAAHALIPLSFICTASVHRFYPFRVGILNVWPHATTVLRFNYVLTALGLTAAVLLTVAHALGRTKAARAGLLLLALVLLAPNDDCPNAFNQPWIRTLGASPLMFVPNVFVLLLASCALDGIRPRLAVAVMMAACIATLGLGIGHITGAVW